MAQPPQKKSRCERTFLFVPESRGERPTINKLCGENAWLEIEYPETQEQQYPEEDPETQVEPEELAATQLDDDTDGDTEQKEKEGRQQQGEKGRPIQHMQEEETKKKEKWHETSDENQKRRLRPDEIARCRLWKAFVTDPANAAAAEEELDEMRNKFMQAKGELMRLTTD
jgi:hypothetical protein